MNKTVGPPSITPNSTATGGINPLAHGNPSHNLYSYYYKSIEQFQKPSTTEKELCEILIKGPMPTNSFYNNFMNEINNRNVNNNNNSNNNQPSQQYQSQPISNLNNMTSNNNSPPSHLPYSRNSKK